MSHDSSSSGSPQAPDTGQFWPYVGKMEYQADTVTWDAAFSTAEAVARWKLPSGVHLAKLKDGYLVTCDVGDGKTICWAYRMWCTTGGIASSISEKLGEPSAEPWDWEATLPPIP